MTMIILALNCGSSSVKYQLYDWDKREIMTRGNVERIGLDNSFITHEEPGKDIYKAEYNCPTHEEAIKLIINTLSDKEVGVVKDISAISAVGHRVVHGGERFSRSVLISDEVIAAIKEFADLAPLHNPHNISGIEAAKSILPGVPQIAVFDTAFHQTMPPYAYIYPLPYEWYKMYGVRRYGFHGTSHLYVSRRAAAILGKRPEEVNVITMHVGNGVSIAAVKKGISVDTSMGLTPLEGAVMGTRCGDIDPAIILFMIEKEGFYAHQLDMILNKKSGLLGITGKYFDRRDVDRSAEAGDERAKLAQEIESYRLKKYIGAYAAAMEGLDAIVFTAGAGELNHMLRERVISGLEFLGVELDKEKNKEGSSREKETIISADHSKVKVMVIPTDEELVFVEDVAATLENRYDIHTKFTYSFQDPKFRRKIVHK
jgi:acetate kinase